MTLFGIEVLVVLNICIWHYLSDTLVPKCGNCGLYCLRNRKINIIWGGGGVGERFPRHSKNGILPPSIPTLLSPIVPSIQCIYVVDLASIHSFLKYTYSYVVIFIKGICNQVLINTLNDISIVTQSTS